MNDKINKFKEEHREFLDCLMDDTWLCEEPIPLKEIKACWYWAIQIGIETVPEDKFEDTFSITFQELTDWWNQDILKVGQEEATHETSTRVKVNE